MRPYYVHTPLQRTWIDLDHALAINEFVSGTSDDNSGYTTHGASFSVVLAFRDAPLSFAVHDVTHRTGFDTSPHAINFTLHPATSMDVDQLKAAYDQLLAVWKTVSHPP